MIVWFSCKGDAEPSPPQSHRAEASPTFQSCWDNNQLQAVKRLQQTAKRRTSSSVGTHTHLSHSCLALLTGLSGRCWLPGFWAERDFPHRRLKSREYAWGNHSPFTHVGVVKMIGGIRRGPYSYPLYFGSAVPSVMQRHTGRFCPPQNLSCPS